MDLRGAYGNRSTNIDGLPGAVAGALGVEVGGFSGRRAGAALARDEARPRAGARAARRGTFRHFELEPVGAASIGQVHRATTLDNRTVAVKVMYPGGRQLVLSDLSNVRSVLRIVKLGLLPAVDEFRDESPGRVRLPQRGSPDGRVWKVLAVEAAPARP